ncbi:hypothetical protein CEXT_431181 [Caerostris extrusa]|uniref:Uncharacterized protein n=1 Tax=Caerostris extrusa TaxID=172846 RepID=A0AAV4N7U2_CAEEX|nr:hypothetical protein CEXT_431181 [Caerostris extrusa]
MEPLFLPDLLTPTHWPPPINSSKTFAQAIYNNTTPPIQRWLFQCPISCRKASNLKYFIVDFDLWSLERHIYCRFHLTFDKHVKISVTLCVLPMNDQFRSGT